MEVARVFLEHGADMEARGRRRIGSTAFGFAEGTCGTCGHVQFLERGADVMVQDKEGSTPLHLASRWGRVEATHMLLERGASVNVQDEDGLTPLHPASFRGHAEVVRMLLEHGADASAHNTTPEVVRILQ